MATARELSYYSYNCIHIQFLYEARQHRYEQKVNFLLFLSLGKENERTTEWTRPSTHNGGPKSVILINSSLRVAASNASV